MTVLIIEDEAPAANKLKQLLKKYDPSIIIVDVIETVEHSINWLQSHTSPDLIFLDIQLNDGICFEIFDVIKVNTPIIFATAYDKYVLKAFKVNSIDYLLKPIDFDTLAAAMDKFQSFIPPRKSNPKIKPLYEQFEKDYKTRFLVKVGLYYTSILTNDIECFYVREHSTYLRTFAEKKYALDYSLQELESMLSPIHFFRVNRNYIVNVNSIVSILSYSTNRLKLILRNSPKDEVLVSREKVNDFKKWLDK